MRDEERLRAHERPRAAAEVEAQLQFGNPPIALHRGAGVALDRQGFVLEGMERKIVEHEIPKNRKAGKSP